MPAAPTDWLLGSFRQPNAALPTPIGPQVCASVGPRHDPRDQKEFAAARARRRRATDVPHQVSYSQHVAPQILGRGLLQCGRLAAPGRGHRLRIKEAAVWHLELRFEHLPDQPVFILQELHHLQRGWASLIPRRFCHAHPLPTQEQQPPDTGQHHGGQQPSYYGPIPWHCLPPQFQTTERNSNNCLSQAQAKKKESLWINFCVRGTGTLDDGVLGGSASWPGLVISQPASIIKTPEVTMI